MPFARSIRYVGHFLWTLSRVSGIASNRLVQAAMTGPPSLHEGRTHESQKQSADRFLRQAGADEASACNKRQRPLPFTQIGTGRCWNWASARGKWRVLPLIEIAH